MKRFLMASALVSVLVCSVMAGDIPTDGAPAPVSGGTTQSTKTEPGDVPTVGKSGEIPSVGKSGQISTGALSAVLSVLSFLTR
jgi:hypothetical protein